MRDRSTDRERKGRKWKLQIAGKVEWQLYFFCLLVAVTEKRTKEEMDRLAVSVSNEFPPVGDDCPYSAEELARMRSEKGGRSLPEIWKTLKGE